MSAFLQHILKTILMLRSSFSYFCTCWVYHWWNK